MCQLAWGHQPTFPWRMFPLSCHRWWFWWPYLEYHCKWQRWHHGPMPMWLHSLWSPCRRCQPARRQWKICIMNPIGHLYWWPATNLRFLPEFNCIAVLRCVCVHQTCTIFPWRFVVNAINVGHQYQQISLDVRCQQCGQTVIVLYGDVLSMHNRFPIEVNLSTLNMKTNWAQRIAE